MNLFGGAAKFVDFTNSKGEQFYVFNNGTIWGSTQADANSRFGISNGPVYVANHASYTIRETPKDITTYFTDGSLYDRIAGTNGHELFDDVHVGDYFDLGTTINGGTQWVTIASLDGLWGYGDTGNEIGYHHAVLIPGKSTDNSVSRTFGDAKMNSTSTTEGGYKSSLMNTSTMPTIDTALTAIFGNHLKTTREYVSSAISGDNVSAMEWIDAKSILMSEWEVFGSKKYSGDIKFQNSTSLTNQLSLFTQTNDVHYVPSAGLWERDVANPINFCSVHGNSFAYYRDAGSTGGVRPRFIIA